MHTRCATTCADRWVINVSRIYSIAVERGRQNTTVHPDGTVTCDGPAAVNLYRLYSLYAGLEFEMKTGMKLTRKAPSCYSIVKREHGLKGNKYRVYVQFCEMHGFDPKPQEELTCARS